MQRRASGSTKGLSNSYITIFHQSDCLPLCSWHLLFSGERVEEESLSWAIYLYVLVRVGLVPVIYGNPNKPHQNMLQGGSVVGQSVLFLWAGCGRNSGSDGTERGCVRSSTSLRLLSGARAALGISQRPQCSCGFAACRASPLRESNRL